MTTQRKQVEYKVKYGGVSKDFEGIEGFDIKFTDAELTCSVHGLVKYRKIGVDNLPENDKCPNCEKEEEKRKEKLEQLENQRRINRAKFDGAGIPRRFRSKSFDNYNPVNELASRNKSLCKIYADKFIDQALEVGTCVIMLGKPGTGKTHLSCAIANQLIFNSDHFINAVFTSTSRMLRDIKDSWSNNEVSEKVVIDKYARPHLLIIDEVGVQFGSDTERNYIFDILNARYEEVLPTILISNLSKNELSEFIGERVLDRFKEGDGFTLEFSWDSQRGEK